MSIFQTEHMSFENKLVRAALRNFSPKMLRERDGRGVKRVGWSWLFFLKTILISLKRYICMNKKETLKF